jgi:sodium-dependent dicarboxylate transporter 2/3/5
MIQGKNVKPPQESVSKFKGLYFLLSIFLAGVLTWFVREPSYTAAQTYVVFLLFLSVGLWLTEAVPPFSVGLLIIAYLAYTLRNAETGSPPDISIYTNTFSSSVIWLMLGGFFLASAMTKTQLDASLIRVALKVSGTNPRRVLLAMMLVTMTASMLISNTATAAMVIAALTPLLTSIEKGSPTSRGLVLGIPIAATTGGMGTVIGSPPNAVALAALTNAGQPVNFVHWMMFGIPVALALTLIAWKGLVLYFLKAAEPLPPSIAVQTVDPSQSAKRTIVIVVLLITVLLWLTNPIHQLSAAAVAAIPLVFLPMSRVLTADDIRAMGWDTLILVAGGLSLGLALQQVGLLDLYAGKIQSLGVSRLALLFILGYITMIFSNVMSNTATSTVLIPLGMAILPESKLEVAMIIGLSTSTALFLPVSTPPNAIAYSTGYVDQKDFRFGGMLVGLLGPPIIVLWVLAVG